MIKFFRNSYFTNYIALVVMALLLWLPSFFTLPECHPSGTTPLYDFIVSGLGSMPWLLLVVALVLFVVEAYAFNEIMIVGKIEPKVSTMGAFVFIVLMGMTNEQTSFQPTLLASVFVLSAMFLLYRIPSRQNVEIDLLNIGICIALASMCYFYSAILLIWILVALSIQKSSVFRLQVIPFIGFVLPYFFFFAFRYIKGDVVEVVSAYSDFFTSFRFTFGGYGVVALSILVLIVLVSFLPLNFNSLFAQERLVEERQNISIASLLFLAALVMMVLADDGVFACGLLFLALSVHNSYWLSHLTNTKWIEGILDFVLILIYILHYLPVFV